MQVRSHARPEICFSITCLFVVVLCLSSLSVAGPCNHSILVIRRELYLSAMNTLDDICYHFSGDGGGRDLTLSECLSVAIFEEFFWILDFSYLI